MQNSGTPLVDVVLVNYKRPQNIVPIISAVANGSAAARITLIDAGNNLNLQDIGLIRQLCDVVFTFSKNYGSINRYIPFLSYSCKYTLFIDDDAIPGSNLVEFMVNQAAKVTNFGALGQHGRKINLPRYSYSDVNYAAGVQTKVHYLARAYFVKTDNLWVVAKYWQDNADWLLSYKAGVSDDIVLSAALDTIIGLKTWITEKPVVAQQRIDLQDAGSADAVSTWRQPNFTTNRQRLIAKMCDCGWTF